MCPNGYTTKPQRVAALWGFVLFTFDQSKASCRLLTLSFLLPSQPLLNLLHLWNCRDSAAAFDAQACHCVTDPAELNHLRPGQEISSCR